MESGHCRPPDILHQDGALSPLWGYERGCLEMQLTHTSRSWTSILVGIALLNVGAFATASVAGAIVGIPLVLAGMGLLTRDLRG